MKIEESGRKWLTIGFLLDFSRYRKDRLRRSPKWKEDIEDGESVMTAEYRPVEYGKDYDVVNNPDKFQLYIDGKEIK